MVAEPRTMEASDGLEAVHVRVCEGWRQVVPGKFFNLNLSTVISGFLAKYAEMDSLTAATDILTEVMQNVMDWFVSEVWRQMSERGMSSHRWGPESVTPLGFFRALRSHRTDDGLWIGFDSADVVGADFGVDNFVPLLFFRVHGVSGGSVHVDLYQFGQDMVDALVLLPISSSTKREKTWETTGCLLGGNFGVGFKQLIAALLSLGMDYEMHGTVPECAASECGEHCGIVAHNSGGLASMYGRDEPGQFLLNVPQTYELPRQRMVQSFVLPGVTETDVWGIITCSHVSLTRLGRPEVGEWILGAHILNRAYPLPDMGPKRSCEDHLIFFKCPGDREPCTYIGGVRYCGESAAGGQYDRLLFTTETGKYVSTARDYQYGSGFYALEVQYGRRLFRETRPTPLKDRTLCDLILDPDTQLSKVLRMFDNCDFKQEVARAIQKTGKRYLIEHEMDSALLSPLWSRLGSDIAGDIVKGYDAVNWLLYDDYYGEDMSPSGVRKDMIFVDPRELMLERAYTTFTLSEPLTIDKLRAVAGDGEARTFLARAIAMYEFMVQTFEPDGDKSVPKLLFWNLDVAADELGLASSTDWYLQSEVGNGWGAMQSVPATEKPKALRNAVVVTPSTIASLEKLLDANDGWTPAPSVLYRDMAGHLCMSLRTVDCSTTSSVMSLHAEHGACFKVDATIQMLAGKAECSRKRARHI